MLDRFETALRAQNPELRVVDVTATLKFGNLERYQQFLDHFQDCMVVVRRTPKTAPLVDALTCTEGADLFFMWREMHGHMQAAATDEQIGDYLVRFLGAEGVCLCDECGSSEGKLLTCILCSAWFCGPCFERSVLSGLKCVPRGTTDLSFHCCKCDGSSRVVVKNED